MIDLSKWIYVEDIANWLSHGPPLDVREQMDCILSAPHRTFGEKLKGLRKLLEEEKDPGVLKDLESYLDTGEYADKAGAYGIQGGAAKHIEKIDGCYFNVMGLPVHRTYELLKQLMEEVSGK